MRIPGLLKAQRGPTRPAPLASKITIGSRNVLVQVHPAGDRSRVLREFLVPNLVVASGRNLVAKLLGNYGFGPSSIALGTDGSTTTDAMTQLGGEVYRALVTERSASGSILTLQLFLSEEEANGNTIREVGLVADQRWQNGVVTTGGGVLFARAVHQAVAKNLDVAMTYTWEFPVTSG